MTTLSNIEEIVSQMDEHVHNSYTELVFRKQYLTDAEFFSLYSYQKRVMRFDPRLQRTTLFEPVLSFIPHKHVEFQELRCFAIQRLHHDSGSKPVKAIVAPAYKEMIFRLYPNIKRLYDTLISEGFTSESDFWLHIIFEFDDHAKSNHITEFKTSGANGARKAVIMPTSSLMDDSSRTMSHLLTMVKRAFSNKHERFRNIFDINNVHANLLEVARELTSFGISGRELEEEANEALKDSGPFPFQCGINDMLYDVNCGSTIDLLAVIESNDNLKGNRARSQPQTAYGIGEDINHCYQSASKFVAMRTIQTLNFFLMKDLGHGDVLNASIFTYEDMMNECILDGCYSEPPLKRLAATEGSVRANANTDAVQSARQPTKATHPTELSAEQIQEKTKALSELIKRRYAPDNASEGSSRAAIAMCLSSNASGKDFPYLQHTDAHSNMYSRDKGNTQRQDAVFTKNFQWLYDFSRYAMAVLFSDDFRELRSDREAFKQKLKTLYSNLDRLEQNLTRDSSDSILFRFENRVKRILKLTEESLK